jgi:hypothetical protein
VLPYLSVHAQWVFKSLACLVQQQKIKFLLDSLKTLSKFKNCTESRIIFPVRLSFAVIGRFSPEYNVKLTMSIVHSWPAFGTIFSITPKIVKTISARTKNCDF